MCGMNTLPQVRHQPGRLTPTLHWSARRRAGIPLHTSCALDPWPAARHWSGPAVAPTSCRAQGRKKGARDRHMARNETGGKARDRKQVKGGHLVEEDEAGLLGAGHLEQLAHHAGALAHVLLHQLAADDADEAGVRAVRHRPCQQRLARACRCIHVQEWSINTTPVPQVSRRQPRPMPATGPDNGRVAPEDDPAVNVWLWALVAEAHASRAQWQSLAPWKVKFA